MMRFSLERAKQDGVPAWLEAAHLHAVKVHEPYRFRFLEKMTMRAGRVRANGWGE